MDAPCEIQRSIHVFRLVNNMCPGKWVHISSFELTTFFVPYSNAILNMILLLSCTSDLFVT